jgi:murein L,D-transpeptidase YafK
VDLFLPELMQCGRHASGKENMQSSKSMPNFYPSSVGVRCCLVSFWTVAHLLFCVLLSLFSALFTGIVAASAGESGKGVWQTTIEEHHATPEHLIVVDKSQQRLSLFERRSPLKQTRLFTCTTGQIEGDKEKEGDLKTPEGIYFVVQRIGSGLEYIKYGTEAYTLNYPNPVDRIRKKTGYGIWLHGRGEPLTPLQTQGCVALNNEDLASLGKLLFPGAPVALTESFSLSMGENSREDPVVSALEKKVQAWAKAWSQRSPTMFDFYDKQAYTIAQGEPFARFQAQKERLFRQLPWIRNSIRDIRILQGPGYWVTWFNQDYRAPNLSTSGVRRLYWARDARGEFKILGMEWAPGMSTGTLLASSESALPPLETQPRTELQALRPAGPLHPAAPFAEGASTQASAPPSHRSESGAAIPAASGRILDAPDQQSHGKAGQRNDPGSAVSSADETERVPLGSGNGQDKLADGKREKNAEKAGKAALLSSEDIAGVVSSRIETWRAAWEARDLDGYIACYAPQARQGTRVGAGVIRAHKRGLWGKIGAVTLKLDNMRMEVLKSLVKVTVRQEYMDDKGGADLGIKTLIFENINSQWLITQEKWSPLPDEARQ